MNKRFIILISLLFVAFKPFAQNFPIQAGLQIIPPYSVYLSDYVSGQGEQLSVNLMLKDLNEPSVDVKLRFSILGEGVEIKTKPSAFFPPITLYGGSMEILSSSDLTEYFKPENLTFHGVDYSSFIQTGRLPEGIYQFCVEVLEYNRGALLSNKGTSIVWLNKSQPPRWVMPWTLPRQNIAVKASFPQNLFFSWIPMHKASPNSAFTTEYEFTIVEVYPENRNPVDAINSAANSPFAHTITTSNISLLYGASEPQLDPGKLYACQIRAFDTEGRDLFDNNGKSEVLTFRFGENCDVPLTANHDVRSPWTANIAWEGAEKNTNFIVRFREENEASNSNWYFNRSNSDSTLIEQLKPETTYEYQIQGMCGSIASEFTDSYTFTTPKAQSEERTCGSGDIPGNFDPNSPDADFLIIGELIKCNGFNAMITKIEKKDGKFYGECDILVPLIGSVIKSEFKGITVNQKNEVTSGEILGIQAPVEPLNSPNNGGQNNGSFIGQPEEIILANLDTYLNQMDSVITKYDEKEVLSPEEFTLLQQEKQKLENIKAKHYNKQIPPLTNEQIAKIDKQLQNINKLESEYSSSLDLLATVKKVVFKPDYSKLRFGIDTFAFEAMKKEYESTQVDGKEYIIPWKSVEAGATGIDFVLAKTLMKDSATTSTAVPLRSKMGTQLSITPGNTKDEQLLTLTGKADEDEEIIEAYYELTDSAGNKTEHIVGQINVKSYEKVQNKLILVNVNGAAYQSLTNLQALKDSLNKIYSQAVASWEVEEFEGGLQDIEFDEDGDSKLDCETSDLFAYTDEIRNVINNLKDATEIDKDAYYLFFMDASKKGKSGFMPLKKHFGFIFMSEQNNQEELLKTVSHELGHGAFVLKHTFAEYETLTQGSTQNLMDYGTGTNLNKWQWDYVHDPQWLVIGGGSEEDGAIDNYDIKLTEISFTGNHNRSISGYQTKINMEDFLNGKIEIDGPAIGNIGKILYCAPHWQLDSQKITRNYPIAYVQNGKINVNLTIKIQEKFDSIKVRASSTDGTNKSAELWATVKDNKMQIKNLILNKKLPNAITKLNNYIINWEIYVGNKWIRLAQTSHDIYILLDETQQETPSNQMYLDFAVSQLNDKNVTNKQKFITELWKKFEIKNQEHSNEILFGYNGSTPKKLHYYLNPKQEGNTAEALCLKGDAQCTAWARLLYGTLMANGIQATVEEITPKNSGENLIVKNWDFMEAPDLSHSNTINGVSYTHLNYSSTEELSINTDGTYNWAGNPDVKDLHGVRGQGNPNPISDFPLHKVTLVDGIWYDPSYGKKYISKEELISSSIAGYHKQTDALIPFGNGQEYYGFMFRKSVNEQNPEETIIENIKIVYNEKEYIPNSSLILVDENISQVKLNKLQVYIGETENVPLELVEWKNIPINKEKETIDFSSIIDKDKEFSIIIDKEATASFKSKKLKAKLSRAPETGSKINAFGYDDMDVSDVSKHHLNVRINHSTWLRIKKVDDFSLIDYKVTPNIATIVYENDINGKAYLKITGTNTGSAKLEVVDKKTKSSVLASINLHIYDLAQVNGEILATYDPSFQSRPGTGLSINEINSKANNILKFGVASINLNQFTNNQVSFDLNGNGELDYYINVGTDYSPEMMEIYNSAGGKDPNNIILLKDSPKKRIFFNESFTYSPTVAEDNKKLVLGPKVLFKHLKIGGTYEIHNPRNNSQNETFTINDTSIVNGKVVLELKSKLKYNHIASSDAANGNYIVPAGVAKLGGLSSIRDAASPYNQRAVVTVLVNTSNTLISNIITHEQLHSLGLKHVTTTDNIMYYSAAKIDETGSVSANSIDGNEPLRFKDQEKCEKQIISGKEVCRGTGQQENQWQTISR